MVGWPWSRKTNDLMGFLAIQAALAWPAMIAANVVSVPQVFVPLAPVSSKLGYTYSLVLFAIPCLLFGALTRSLVKNENRTWAFWITITVLCPLGYGVDILFGRKFFKFDAPNAVLASRWGDWWTLPAYDNARPGVFNWVGGIFHSGNWERYIPFEEMLFYTLGFITILLLYVWADAILFRRHKVERTQRTPKIFQTMQRSIVSCLVIVAAIFGIALAMQRWLNPHGFPGYLLFLLTCAALPTMVCFHVAYRFVNWRALTVAWLFLLVISQFWEGSLGVPYQWWGYKEEEMIGWKVLSQCRLPVEAVMVWSLATWTTILVYETVLAVFQLPPTGPGVSHTGGLKQSGPLPTGVGARFKRRLNLTAELLKSEADAGHIPTLLDHYENAGQAKRPQTREPEG